MQRYSFQCGKSPSLTKGESCVKKAVCEAREGRLKMPIFACKSCTPLGRAKFQQTKINSYGFPVVLLAIFFHETKEKPENISLMFSSCNHSHTSDLQPNTLNYSQRTGRVVLNETRPLFLGFL